jgi:signal transduction histidine kinase
MKLFNHYNRVNFITTVVVLFITGIVYYQAISYILNHQVDTDLKAEEVENLDFIKQHNSLPPPVDLKDQRVTFEQTETPVKRQFINKDFYNKKEHELEAGRALILPAKVKNRDYQIIISESKVETEDLIRIVFIITLGVTLLLLFVLFITNRFVLSRIWRPFYSVLNQLRMFSLNDTAIVASVQTNIDEFDELDKAVAQMTTRVKTDYNDLKIFTENASHELLTPIAVINSKLDSLLQTGHYNEQQSKLLNDVYAAVSRLTRLNQSLVLLVKLENKLLQDNQLIELKPLIEEKANQFRELFADKNINFSLSLVDKQILLSPYLAEVLLNNLFSNAMRHNYQNGEIKVCLSYDKFVVQNTGNNNALSENDIFKRFSKSSASEGTGLGLTISKQICENYGYKLSYHFDVPYHTFTVTFN